MGLAQFWQHNLKWTLILWIAAALWFHVGLSVLGIGVVVWFAMVYLTTPGVFWTYVYALPFITSNPERSTKILQKAVKYKPLISLPYLALGMTYLRAERWEESILLLEEAARLANRKLASDTKTVLAVAYRETGQFSKTYALLDELIGQGIRNLKIFYNYALCFLLQKRYDEALEAAKTACSFDPKVLEPVLLLGKVQFERGEIQAAKDNWEWAVNRKPTLVEPYYWLGRAELELGEVETAITHLKLALNRIDDHPRLSNVSAEEAKEWLKKAEAGKV